VAPQSKQRARRSDIGSLAIVFVGAAGALFFAWIKLFKAGTLPGLSQRSVNDGLTMAALIILAGLYVYTRPVAGLAQPAQPRRLDRWLLIPLCALILVAAFFRFHKLDFQSLWRDEVASVARVESPTLSGALTLGNWQDAWPSYHIPLYVFERLAGDSEFALRFPSALAGVLLIPVLFALGRRMFAAREGLLAAGFAVALRAPLWYSQETRSYAFLTLFAALSGYFWFRLAQDVMAGRKPRRLALIGYVASAILTIYAHYFGLVLMAVEGLGALALMISLRRVPLVWAAAFAAIGVSYLPWLPLMISDLDKKAFWAGKPSWFGGRLFGLFIFLFRRPLDFIVLGLAAISLAAILWQRFRRRGQGWAPPPVVTPGIVLAGWLILPYAIGYWRSVTATPILVDRYLLISLPPAYLLLARAITRLPVGRLAQGLVGAGLVAFVTVRLVSGPYYTAPNKPQLREAIQVITSRESQYPDAVIIGGYQGGIHELDYYFRKFGSAGSIDIKAGNTWQIDDVRTELARRKPHYIWFLGQYLFYEKEFQDFLDQDYKPAGEWQFFQIRVFLYENPAAR
jgi:4-amino-4-deoxy-L-arabinose transferase-like glycosyltransferase